MSKAPKPQVIGMIHLKALPGSPLFGGSMDAIEKACLADAQALIKGGVHGIMMENFFDVPFTPGSVDPVTIAAMTRLACAVRQTTDLPLGINVLRNDATAAMSIAVACGAAFIRVNVLCGARVTDQGVIQGCSYDLMRLRKNLGAEHIEVFADVDVKHSAPLSARSLKDEVEDTIKRGLADRIIVSGAGTGKAADPSKINEVIKYAGKTPVLLGSGANSDNLEELPSGLSGYIVGSSLKKDGLVEMPVDMARVKKFVAAAKAARK
jgi:membrane complex biogenesis BtpA family protein